MQITIKGESMSEKRVVSRNVAIALGIIVVIVLAGLVGAAANYTSIINDKDSQIQTLTNQKNQFQTWLNGNLTYYKSLIESKDSEIANLQNQISNLNSQVNSLNAQIASLQNQITSLQSQVNDLNDIITLAKYEVWVDHQTVNQLASSYAYWIFSASYAGYLTVTVHTSTTDKTYVQVIWDSYGVHYDHSITVGTSGTAVFPVLPCSNVEIRVGNTNLFSGATETVTITYHY
jgi:predicted PurR-regulated permease PerM